MRSKMSFTTPRSPRIAARLRVRLRAIVQKEIEPNASSSVLWDWSIYSKNSNLFSTCFVWLFNYLDGSCTLVPFDFSLMCSHSLLSHKILTVEYTVMESRYCFIIEL